MGVMITPQQGRMSEHGILRTLVKYGKGLDEVINGCVGENDLLLNRDDLQLAVINGTKSK